MYYGKKSKWLYIICILYFKGWLVYVEIINPVVSYTITDTLPPEHPLPHPTASISWNSQSSLLIIFFLSVYFYKQIIISISRTTCSLFLRMYEGHINPPPRPLRWKWFQHPHTANMTYFFSRIRAGRALPVLADRERGYRSNPRAWIYFSKLSRGHSFGL